MRNLSPSQTKRTCTLQAEYDPGLSHTERKWSCLTHRGGLTDHNKPVRPDGSTVHSLSSETNETKSHCMTLQVIILRKPAHSPQLWMRKNFQTSWLVLICCFWLMKCHTKLKYEITNQKISSTKSDILGNKCRPKGRYMTSNRPLLALQSRVQLICSWRTNNRVFQIYH